MILQAIRLLGIPCEFSGRNDLLADGRKFSGNAFCQRGEIRQHHGTLLIRADMAKLQNYLQVDSRKLQAKGVSSVRSRVCNLSEFREDLTVPMVLSAMKQAFRKAYGRLYGMGAQLRRTGSRLPPTMKSTAPGNGAWTDAEVRYRAGDAL